MKIAETVIRVLVVSSVLAALSPAAGRAQDIAGPVKAGACTLVVNLSPPVGARTEVEFEINKKALPRLAADGKPQVTVVLKAPLEEGDEIRARRVDPPGAPGSFGPVLKVAKSEGEPECKATGATRDGGDGREPFDASGYVGYAVDNFAPTSVGGYANPDVGGKRNRVIGGFDFEFRVAGTPQSTRQVWIYGETLHGVRSADVDCAAADKPPVCGKLTEGNVGGKLQYVLENATSMEAYVGIRAELLTLQAGTGFPAKVYATGRMGVMMLNGKVKKPDGTEIKADHGYRAHHVGAGLLMSNSKFEGSYLEVGWGRTELFGNPDITNQWRRLKIDGVILFEVAKGTRGFVQLYSDFDPSGKSADSIQTFFGVDFAIGEFFK